MSEKVRSGFTKTTVRLAATVAVVALIGGALSLAYDGLVLGDYLASAGVFLTAIVGALLLLAVLLGVKVIRAIWTAPFSEYFS